MNAEPRVGIVVLNWRLAPATLACVGSLDRLTYPNVEVLVVDNGSDDGSEAVIREARPDVPLLQTGSNLGYAGGNNIGIREAIRRGAEFVWVLNNDTLVEPDSLSALVTVARAHPDAGIVGSAVLNTLPAEEAEGIAAEAYGWKGERLAGFACPRDPRICPADGHEVDGVAGTSVLLRSAMVQDIGGFEERFFHYWDDVEYCERARAAGWTVRYGCAGRVWHAVSATLPYQSPQARYYYIRNWLHFSAWSKGQRLPDLLRTDPALTVARVTGARWLLRGRWPMAAASVLATADAVRGRVGMRRVRVGSTRARDADAPASTSAGTRAASRVAAWLMRRTRRDPLYSLDPDIPLGTMAGIFARKGSEAFRGLLLLPRVGGLRPPCFVGRRVTIRGGRQLRLGRGCQIGDLVLIDAVSRRGVRIGDDVTLDRAVVLKCTGALRELGEGIEIGDGSSIGAFSYLGGSGGLTIGRNVLGGQRLSFHPENHSFERADLPIRAQGTTRRGIVVQDDCWLGSGAILLDGVTVGRGSVVAAGSVVTEDVPPLTVVAGVPARVIRRRDRDPSAGPSADA